LSRAVSSSVAGRVMLKRDMGKLSFLTLRDETGDLQVALDKRRLDEKSGEVRGNIDLGDLLLVEGRLGTTNKGETTVWASCVEMAAKALLPPPAKWQGLADVEPLVGRFDIVNIKLDKCGGLTEGLAMAAEARRLGLGVMVGNMVGTSLAMAPAWILGQLCDISDLDGTLFISRDREVVMSFENGKVSYPDRGWGAPN
jgi:hypothetical protein